MNEVESAVLLWWASVTWTEIFGALTGLCCVWLYGRESMWAWPIGIANAALFAVMFFSARLYSDVVLQIVFLILSLHGWLVWAFGGPAKTRLKISVGLPIHRVMALVLTTVGVASAAGSYFARCTDAALPYWDAVILAASLTAQWLLNKKQIENWLVWVGVDVLAVGTYAYRGLLLTSLLYGIFFVLALRGYFAWRRTVAAANGSQVAAVP
jgi:nicotinamide mononucleotide transporter